MNDKKILLAIAIIAWSGFVVALYFGIQKPLALQVFDHLLSLAWTFIVTLMLLLNALALGKVTIKRIIPDATDDASLLALAGGIGLGELGLLGFVLAATGASNFYILLIAQILLIGWFVWRGLLREVFAVLKSVAAQIKSSGSSIPRWMKGAAGLALALTFLMTLLPPADAFDALLYHLTIPELWLRDGGLQAYNIPHYWFPGLVEGVYFWGLGLGSEIVPQQIHFAWALFTMLIIWDWTRRIWDNLTAWWALMLIISIPSVLLLASWAYTDLALIFFGVAMLYTLSLGREQSDTRWWRLSAICAGMGMSVKYTSIVMPIAAIILITIWEFRQRRDLLVELTKFIFISAAIALIWYLRNWIWMGNPFYPFVFGGRYWDSFRADWFAGAGSGSGWDLRALVLLPFTVTLRYQDANSIDANIGPLLLLTLPWALWIIATAGQRTDQVGTSRKITLTTISLFTFLGAAFWIYGYITTRNLWQARLLLPAIIPFVIPAAAGITSIGSLNTKQLRPFFIVSSIAAMAIYLNLLDMGLSVISRNPLSTATGIVTSQKYYERYQPGYADALRMVSDTPSNSRIYALFEPRSYGMTRRVQPDPILDNFSHDIFLSGDPETILKSWQLQGYTHVLLNRRGANMILNSMGESPILDTTLDLLDPIAISHDETYELFEIPARSSE